MMSYYGDTGIATGNEMLDSLVETHGINGMLSTVFLIFCAATFGGTLTGCGMTQSTALKVPTPDYLPYCFFNLLSPLMSITICAIGYKIHRKAN